MANELAIGLVIGASLRGVQSAFGSAQNMLNRLGRGIERTTALQTRMENVLRRGANRSGRDLSRLQRHYEQLSRAIRSAERSQERLNKSLAWQSKLATQRQSLRGQMMETGGHIMAMGMPIKKTIGIFIEQEESANNLKIAMMKADGTFGKFEEIGKIAGDLGNELPGTRKDFYNLARALKMQGISDNTLIGGGLKTSANLNVLLEMDQVVGGEFFAKMLEAHNLSEAEMAGAADDLQRAMFAAGMNKEQMYGAMAYYASNVRSMKLTGRENTQKIFAIEGLAAQQGMEGTSFGTGFSTMLDRMNKGPKMLAEAKKGMKAEAADIMNKSGVKFEFWDKKGTFKGINAMITELEKLDVIRQKFGDEGAGLVAEGIFGVEGKRLALLLAEKGSKGLQEFLDKMQAQASLQDRVAQKTRTLGSALEALGGVWESALGTFGSAFADDIKAFAKSAQILIEERLTPWIAENKSLIKTTVGIIGGFLGVKAATLGIAYAANLVISPFVSLWTFANKLNAAFNFIRLARFGGQMGVLGRFARQAAGGLRFLASGGMRLASVLGGTLFKGMMLAGKAVLFIGRALMMNPIGLIITGVAVAAYLIYQYWEPIKAFFAGLWDWVKVKFEGAWNWISGIWSQAGAWFSGIWEQIKGFFNSGIGNITATILNWSPLGLFYQAFAGVLSWFGIELPNNFTDYGKNIIDGLVNGIRNAWEGAKQIVSDLGSGIKSWFAEKLGIHSPSRVFMGFGVNTVEGLAIGLEKVQHLAKDAVGSIADKMITAMPATIQAPTLADGGIVAGVAELMGKTQADLDKAAVAMTQRRRLLLGESEPMKKRASRPKVRSISTAFRDTVAPITQAAMVNGLNVPKPESKGFWGGLWESVKGLGHTVAGWFKGIDWGRTLNFGSQLLLGKPLKLPQADWRTPAFTPHAEQPEYQSLQQRFKERQAQQSQSTNIQGGITVHFNPTIQVNGNQSSEILNGVKEGLNMSLIEFERLFDRMLDQRQRRAY